MLFRDKVVLVTGGSSGIGLAAANKFAQEGARVAILARGEERLVKAAQEIRQAASDTEVRTIVCDIRDELQVEDAFIAVTSSIGPVDVVVNNAGWGINSPFEETSLKMWQEIMDVYCTGYFLVAREAVRTFIRQKSGGAIVFVTSDNAIRPSRNLVAYCTAKAAELQMARCIADECGKYGIRVNSVLPGAVFGRSSFWTPEFRAARAQIRGFDPNNLEEEYKKNSALGVVIDPDEVADLILFLASEKAVKITGAAISVDGGGTAAYVR
jgi:NAD(P)-dependent dehydrogenase (short-subunit alcohol dehydrogenase family)